MRIVNNTLEFAAGLQNIERDIIAIVRGAGGGRGTITALDQLVAGRLHKAGEQVVVFERADNLAAQASGLGHLVVQGDARVDDAVLDHAKIAQVEALVVTTEDSDRKLSITLMAHSRNPMLTIAVTGAAIRRRPQWVDL